MYYDYVLVYKIGDNCNFYEKLWKKYEVEFYELGFRLDWMYIVEKIFVVLYCLFERFCEEVEKVLLEMFLVGVSCFVFYFRE